MDRDSTVMGIGRMRRHEGVGLIALPGSVPKRMPMRRGVRQVFSTARLEQRRLPHRRSSREMRGR